MLVLSASIQVVTSLCTIYIWLLCNKYYQHHSYFFYLSASEVQVMSVLLPQSKWAKSQNHPSVALPVNKSHVQMWTSPLGLLLTSALAVIHSHLFYNGLLQSTQHPKSTPTDGRMPLGVCPMSTPMVVQYTNQIGLHRLIGKWRLGGSILN